MPPLATRSATTARSTSKAKVDLTAFAVTVRKFSREMSDMCRVVRAPFPNEEDAKLLVRTIDELERKALHLRGLFSGTLPGSAHRTSNNKSASNSASTRPRLIFDTIEEMVGKGQLVEPVKFQELMGWKTRQAVWKAATDNRMFYMELQSERYFPAFYADPAYQRSHLEAVTKILGDLPGGSKLQFFLTRKGSLDGKTPLEALAAGDLAKVKSVAMAFAEIPMKA